MAQNPAVDIPPPPPGFEMEVPPPPPGFALNEGGAATGVSKPARVRSTTLGVPDIAASTAFGAAAGAVAPELLGGAAAVARAFPATAPIAPALDVMAQGTRAAGRPMSAIAGGLSGFFGETAGKAAEAAGAGPVTSEAARLGGGLVGPVAPQAMGWAAGKYLATPALSFWSKIRKEGLKKGWELFKQEPLTTEKEQQYRGELISDLRGGPISEKPQQGVFGAIESGAQSKIAASQQEASRIMEDAQRAISRELEQAQKGPVAYSRAASNRIVARGEDALATAKMQRQNVGEDADLSDIGAGLRKVIVDRNEAAIAQRRAQYEIDQKARDSVVYAKEASGDVVSNTPEFRSLVNELRTHLKPGVHSPDVAASYQKMLDSLLAPRDASGTRRPTSFQAVDEVRKKLGDVYGGQPAEGYDAIGEAAARKYYALLSRIQSKYAGPAQDKLLENYAASKEGTQMFGSRLGKRATAVDRYDDSKFQTDAMQLPRQYFSSKQGVADLIELTGDRNLVLKGAHDFAANELRDLNATGVRNWMTKRRELLSALPELRDSIIKYEQGLTRGESIQRQSEQAVKRLSQYEKDVLTSAESSARSRMSEAERQARGITSEAERQSSVMLGNRFPVSRVNQLIESGNREQWQLAAPDILASPGGKQMLAESVRQVLADKASASPRGLTRFFNDNVREALEATNMMSRAETDAISAKLGAIENLKIPDEQKLKLTHQLILQTFGGYASTLAGRAGVGTYSSLADLVPPQVKDNVPLSRIGTQP